MRKIYLTPQERYPAKVFREMEYYRNPPEFMALGLRFCQHAKLHQHKDVKTGNLTWLGPDRDHAMRHAEILNIVLEMQPSDRDCIFTESRYIEFAQTMYPEPAKPQPPKRISLYRHFCKDGELLYIGVSLSVVKRLMQHKNNSAWADEIATITVEYFDTREEALEEETKAIIAERPKMNRKDVPIEARGA